MYKFRKRIAFCIIASFFALSSSSAFATDITSEADLQNIAIDLNGNYTQTVDLILSGSFAPILGSFQGTYDGGDHKITGLQNNLFESLGDGAVIENVNLNNVAISQAGEKVAALAQQSSGEVSIDNVTISGSVENTASTGTSATAGLIAENDGSLSITNTFVDELTVSTASGNVGGLIGSSNGAIAIETTTVDAVVSASGAFAGGVIGTNESTTLVSNSTINAIVTAPESYVGGVIGAATGDVSIINSNIGTSVSGGALVGGAVGKLGDDNNQMSLVIDGSFIGTETIGSQDFVGGVIGNSTALTTVDISQSDFEISVTGGDYVGGLVGGGDLVNIEYATVLATVNQNDEIHHDIGGLIGAASGLSIDSALIDATVSGSRKIGGIAGTIFGDATLSSIEAYVSVSGGEYVGGYIGAIFDGNFDALSSSSITGDVTGSTSVGGVVGYMNETSQHRWDHQDEAPYVFTANFDQFYASDFHVNFNPDIEGDFGNTLGDFRGSFGGLVGQGLNLQVSDSVFDEVFVTGSDNVGGLIGTSAQVSIYPSSVQVTGATTFTGTVQGSGNNVGGVAGYIDGNLTVIGPEDSPFNLNFSGSASNDFLLASGVDYVGGLAGLVNYTSNISFATVEGVVSGSTEVGGFIGRQQSSMNVVDLPFPLPFDFEADSVVIGTQFNGSVIGQSDVGGLYGYAQGNTFIAETLVYADIGLPDELSDSPQNHGGFIGTNYKNLLVGYSQFEGSVTGGSSVGGIVGDFGAGSHSEGDIETLTLLNVGVGAISGVDISSVMTDGWTPFGVGGLIGSAELQGDDSSLNILGSTFFGTISSEAESVGGLVGNVSGFTYIDSSIVGGSIEGLIFVGGAIGNSDSNIIIQNSDFSAEVVGIDNYDALSFYADEMLPYWRNYETEVALGFGQYVGGAVGLPGADIYIENTVVDGNVTGYPDCVGLVIGCLMADNYQMYPTNLTTSDPAPVLTLRSLPVAAPTPSSDAAAPVESPKGVTASQLAREKAVASILATMQTKILNVRSKLENQINEITANAEALLLKRDRTISTAKIITQRIRNVREVKAEARIAIAQLQREAQSAIQNLEQAA